MTATHTRRPGAIVDGENGGVARLIASGEFDMDNQHLLTQAVRRAIGDGYQIIAIDMSAVSFVSAGVVHALLDCQRFAQTHGRRLRLDHVSGLPAYVLEITHTRARLCEEPAE